MNMGRLRQILGWPLTERNPTPLESVILQSLQNVRASVQETNNEIAATNAFFDSFRVLMKYLEEDFPPPMSSQPVLNGLRFKSSSGGNPLSESATGADFAIAFYVPADEARGAEEALRLAVFQAKLETDGRIEIGQRNPRYGTRQLFDLLQLAVQGRKYGAVGQIDWNHLDWVHYVGWRDSAWERVVTINQIPRKIQELHRKETSGRTVDDPTWFLVTNPNQCRTFFDVLLCGALVRKNAGGSDGWLTLDLAHAGAEFFPALVSGLFTYVVCDKRDEQAFLRWKDRWSVDGKLDDSPGSSPRPLTRRDMPESSIDPEPWPEDPAPEWPLREQPRTNLAGPEEIASHWEAVRREALRVKQELKPWSPQPPRW